MKAQRLFNRLNQRINAPAPDMSDAEILGCLDAISSSDELDSLPYRHYELIRLGMAVSFALGMFRAYTDTIDIVGELDERERAGKIRSALAILKDNGVSFKEDCTTPFGYPNYRITGLPEDVKL